MKIQTTLLATIVTLASIASVHAAPKPVDAKRITSRQNVSYVCQSNKSVNVQYGFNAAGIPVNASVKLAGATRVLPYDLASSDNVDTNFQDKKGYRISMENMEKRNVRKAAIATITTPNGEIAYTDCSPR